MDSIEVYLAAIPASGGNTSILSLILDADIIVQLTLFTLVMMSVSCLLYTSDAADE